MMDQTDKKLQSMWQRIGVIAGGVVLLTLAIGAGRLVHDHMHHQSPTQPQTLPSYTEFAAMQQIIATAQAAVTANYSTDYKTDTRIWYGENTDEGMAIAVKGYDFRLSSSSEPTLEVWPVESADAILDKTWAPSHAISDVYNTISSVLFKKYGFQAADSTMDRSEAAELSRLGGAVADHVMLSGDKSCRVSETTSTDALTMTCGSTGTDTYLAAQMALFVQEYSQAKNIPLKNLVAGPLTIKSQDPLRASDSPITASETAGYDIAELDVRNGNTRRVALYYERNGAWHFVTAATDEWGFDCTPILQNPDARQALHDQICYDFKDNSGQVRVDSARGAL